MNAVSIPVSETDPRSIVAALHALRQQAFDRSVGDRLCYLLRLLCRADAVVLLRRDESRQWTLAGQDLPGNTWLLDIWAGTVHELGDRALERGYSASPALNAAGISRLRLAIRVNGITEGLALLDLPESERPHLNELALRALLASDLSADGTLVNASASDVRSVSGNDESVDADPELLSVLDLAAVVMQETRFHSAVLALVNGLAARAQAEQVAVGWIINGRVVTKAISHLDNFDRHAESVMVLEEAFEEVIVHDAEVLFSLDEELLDASADIWPAHRALVDWIEMSASMSLPLRDTNGITIAILTLVFAEELPDAAARDQIRLLLNIIEPWLRDLQERDRNVIHRAGASATRLIETATGPGHVGAKVAAIVGAIVFLILVFGTWPFRIEATSQLTTDSTRVITAQFDGRVDEVRATAGDEIRAQDVLAKIDTRELDQQSAEVQAEIARYSSEADRARATGNLGEMEIALSRQSQAVAKQQRLDYYVQQASIASPFDGVVVEGERKDLLGSAVRKGDKLFRVARVEGLYLTLMVPERDIRYIQPQATGRLHLLSRPDQTVRFRLSSLIPVAQVKGQEGNHFMMKAELLDPVEPWWRPGMSGVVRIDAGDRNIGWLLTHRLIDALRMYFWW